MVAKAFSYVIIANYKIEIIYSMLDVMMNEDANRIRRGNMVEIISG